MKWYGYCRKLTAKVREFYAYGRYQRSTGINTPVRWTNYIWQKRTWAFQSLPFLTDGAGIHFGTWSTTTSMASAAAIRVLHSGLVTYDSNYRATNVFRCETCRMSSGFNNRHEQSRLWGKQLCTNQRRGKPCRVNIYIDMFIHCTRIRHLQVRE